MSLEPELHYYIYYRTHPNPDTNKHVCSDRPCEGHITYDRTMPYEYAAKRRVVELQEKPHIESAWYQTKHLPEAFY